jgi:iron-sulfur cluster repair protein YtfE (RIC family)
VNIEKTSAPAPSVVRSTIVAQHFTLREKLSRVRTVATNALRGEPVGALLANVVRDLGEHFLTHLDFEETWLFPLLEHIDGWGPARVQELLESHRAQRAEIDTLIDRMRAGWKPQWLAVATRNLVTELLLDLEKEEHGWANHPAFRGDVATMDGAAY